MNIADGPANRPTSEFFSKTDYAALVYGKAPQFYDQLRKTVGDERYFKTLRAYCDQNRWGIARIDTFTNMLVKGASNPKQLTELKKRWWDEAHGDEDLGKPAIGDMFGGGAGAQGIDANTVKMLEEAIRAMGGE